MGLNATAPGCTTAGYGPPQHASKHQGGGTQLEKRGLADVLKDVLGLGFHPCPTFPGLNVHNIRGKRRFTRETRVGEPVDSHFEQ